MFEAHFQSFEEPETGVALTARLSAFREELARRNLSGFVIPRADRHQNEYVPPSEERLAWLTGFTGSAGAGGGADERAAHLRRWPLYAAGGEAGRHQGCNRAAGRAAAGWLAKHLPAATASASTPGCTPRRPPNAAPRPAPRPARHWSRSSQSRSMRSGPTVRRRRSARSTLHARNFPARRSRQARSASARRSPSSAPTRWCCRIPRGGLDLQHPRRRRRAYAAPLVLCARAEGRPSDLFIDRRKLSNSARDHLEHIADVEEPDALTPELTALAQGRRVIASISATAADALSRLISGRRRQAGARHDPVSLPKAGKNTTEIEGTRDAHLRDGAALARFLAWFDREAPAGALTEIDAVEALESFRRDTGALKDLSFPTIAGAGPNGAIVHYRVTRKTNRRIAHGELFLIDSGAQYRDGTTDVTRTVAVGTPTAEMRDRFTRVLKGHIALARALFPGRHHRRAARYARAPVPVGGRPGLRSRHRPWRRHLSLGA